MPNLSERKMCSPDTCKTCKHSWCVKIETSEQDYDEYYCMLDVPEKDRDYVEAEVADDLGGYIPKRSEFSERFCEIMQVKEYIDLWDTPRYVECTDSCQFHEKPSWKENLNDD